MGADKDEKSNTVVDNADDLDQEIVSGYAGDGRESPTFEVIENGRPSIRYQTVKKFRTGDSVYIRVPGSTALDGPYLIASAISTGGYTLCVASGALVRNGSEIAEDDLVAA